MIAGKHLDMIVGVDLHMIQPPPPAPPLMVPHPVAGMVLDPADYSPGGCTVFINGLPRARAGTMCMMIPPHIPLGGMFVMPPLSETEIYQGSSTVTVDGDAFSAGSHQVLGCHDVGAPAPVRGWKSGGSKSLMQAGSVLLCMPAGAPVMVGGAPTTSLSAEDSEPTEKDWISVEIVDTDGQPFTGWYELELADGSIRGGSVGADGLAEVWVAPSGKFKLALEGSLESMTCATGAVVGPRAPREIVRQIRQGENVRSIACAFGIGAKWEELWAHADNSALRAERPDASELLPGDRLTIPARLLERLELTTGEPHRVEVRVAKSPFDLVLLDARRRALANKAVTITWRGKGSPLELTTDGGGNVRFELPTLVDEAVLTVDTTPAGAPRRDTLTWALRPRTLDPATTWSGVHGRLANLGQGLDSLRHLDDEPQAPSAAPLAEAIDKRTRKRE